MTYKGITLRIELIVGKLSKGLKSYPGEEPYIKLIVLTNKLVASSNLKISTLISMLLLLFFLSLDFLSAAGSEEQREGGEEMNYDCS